MECANIVITSLEQTQAHGGENKTKAASVVVGLVVAIEHMRAPSSGYHIRQLSRQQMHGVGDVESVMTHGWGSRPHQLNTRMCVAEKNAFPTAWVRLMWRVCRPRKQTSGGVASNKQPRNASCVHSSRRQHDRCHTMHVHACIYERRNNRAQLCGSHLLQCKTSCTRATTRCRQQQPPPTHN